MFLAVDSLTQRQCGLRGWKNDSHRLLPCEYFGEVLIWSVLCPVNRKFSQGLASAA